MSCELPNEFCFIGLNKGSKIIGSICVISSGICSIILMVYLFSDFESIKEELSDKEQDVMTKLDETKTDVQATAGIFLGLFILYLLASLSLIKGLQEKSKKLLIPFLIMTAAVVIISVIFAFIQLNHEPFYAILTLSLILFYFFICVLSLYKKMSD